MHDDEGEEGPEKVPQREVDRLQRHRGDCHEGDSVEQWFVRGREVALRQAPARVASERNEEDLHCKANRTADAPDVQWGGVEREEEQAE